MAIFNFYNEIKKDYGFLIPERKLGMVIFYLYQRQKKGEIGDNFYENDILDAFREVREDLATNQKEQFSLAIKTLQKYFLWRDTAHRTYRFKPFTLQWCEMLDEQLFATFKPTEIRQGFLFLLDTLKENNFGEWYDLSFIRYRDKINNQISALDIQVFASVTVFRYKLANEHSYDLIALKKIVDGLGEIRDKMEELDGAFDGASEINRKLLRDPSITKNADLNQKRKEVNRFFGNLSANLRIISKRIDSVKPKLNEYIRDVNRRDFVKRFKKFLDYVLVHSSADKTGIHLPDWLPRMVIGGNQDYRFTMLKDKLDKNTMGQLRTSCLKQPDVDQESTLQHLEIENKKCHIRKQVKVYLNELIQLLKQQPEFDFSAYFFKVIEQENGNIDIAVKLAYQVMMVYMAPSSEFDILITREKVKNPKYKNIVIWKTVIFRKS